MRSLNNKNLNKNKKVNPRPKADFFDGDWTGSRARLVVQAVN